MSELLTIQQASKWASEHLKRNVTEANISYLVQYGRVRKRADNGSVLVDKDELIRYYHSFYGKREVAWKDQLGHDINWALSFESYKEKETTKHVHRLHPYKGKFIPQLVEYFLDDHTDDFKKQVYFKKGDVVLDPFCGSGTALVQASELGMHAIGIDISVFNALIANAKVGRYDFFDLQKELRRITNDLKGFVANSKVVAFENRLLDELKTFNDEFFPVPEYKYKVSHKEIDGDKYGNEKEGLFLPIFHKLVEEYGIQVEQKADETFLDKWYLQNVRNEIDFVFDRIKEIENPRTKKIIAIILSRTIRSCRATTHADLGTLKEPINTTYYCAKHGKICKPLFSILKWWNTYSKDTVKRLHAFNRLRTDTHQFCITGDSRTVDVLAKLEERKLVLAEIVSEKKIAGIFSSPPYVGLIDYHEQHAYAYDLFGFDRQDELEIGPLFKGQGVEARESYANGIAEVLKNCKRFLKEDFDIFLVANDKYNLYPKIAEKSGLRIVNQFKRPVLNRTERDKAAYAETIFHMKEGRSAF